MESIIKFLNKLNEICEGHPGCCYCPLRSFNNGRNVKCFDFLRQYPEEAIEIILRSDVNGNT